MALRPALVSLHRWIGMTFAILLLSQGLTGAAMVFRDDLNRAIHHDALTVVPASTTLQVQSLLEKVREAHPALHIERIEYPKRRTDAFVFRLEAHDGGDQRYVAVDPYRGTITRDAPVDAWPVQWLFRLHHQLLAGETGEIVVGITGVALLLLALSAPFLWWPGRRNLRRGFSVTLSGGAYRGIRDLHRVGGVIVVAVLLAVALTGIVIVWKSAIQSVAGQIMPMQTKPSPKVATRTDAALLPIDAIVTAARARYGDAPVKNVRFPGGHGRVVVVFLETAGSTRPRASDQIWFNGYTADVLGTYEAATLPSGSRLLDWVLPIHTGEALGMPGRLLFLLAALALPGLAVTGVLQWYKRRQLQQAAPAVLSQLGRARVPANVFDVVVSRAWDETAAVRALELRAADGHDLPLFTAGAHIDVYLPNGIVRQYSIWSDERDRSCYCIAVLRQPDSRGGSISVHALHAGATLRIGAPRNSFALVESAPAFVLVAGGIGVTPILSMATRLAVRHKPFTIHYCARSRADAAFIARLQQVAPIGALTLHLGDEPHPGRFDARTALSGAAADTHVYVCGPTRLIEAVSATAHASGWAQDRMHSELFQAAPPDADAQAFDLQLRRSGRIVHVPADRSALDVLAEHGIAIPSSCGLGLCGTCTTTVIDGVPDHRDHFLTADERECGAVFTPCCSRARTPVLVLDL